MTIEKTRRCRSPFFSKISYDWLKDEPFLGCFILKPRLFILFVSIDKLRAKNMDSNSPFQELFGAENTKTTSEYSAYKKIIYQFLVCGIIGEFRGSQCYQIDPI